MIEEVAELAVVNYMHQGLKNISQLFDKKLGIKIYRGDKEFERIFIAVEIRNLLVHNNGIINRKFLQKTKLSLKRGNKIKIKEDYLMKTADLLFNTAIYIDQQVKQKFLKP